MNENTLEEIWKIKASMFSGAVLLIIFAFVLITITSAIIIATPIRYYLPGYLDAEIREKALRASIQIDSLEQQLNYQEIYISNLRNIFTGTVNIDSVKLIDTVSVSENDPSLQKSEIEREFNKRYEEEERYNLSALPSSPNTPMEGLIFFKPVKGVIIDKYNPTDGRYGITLNVSGKETVSAALEGSVIFAGLDIKAGYTIQIQHKNGFISIYKNNTTLLKNFGDKVKTGEAIAVIDNKKESDNLFEFELWYKGNAMNPETYITF